MDRAEYLMLADAIYDWVGLWEVGSYFGDATPAQIRDRLRALVQVGYIEVVACAYDSDDNWPEFQRIGTTDLSDDHIDLETLFRAPTDGRYFVLQAPPVWEEAYRRGVSPS